MWRGFTADSDVTEQVQWADNKGEEYCHGYCHPMLVCPPGLPIAFYEMPKAASSSMKRLLAKTYDIERPLSHSYAIPPVILTSIFI